MKEEDLARQKRLWEFFSSNPPIWDDFVAEIDICMKNAQEQIDNRLCVHREYLAGYRSGQKDILKFKDQYKNKFIDGDFID